MTLSGTERTDLLFLLTGDLNITRSGWHSHLAILEYSFTHILFAANDKELFDGTGIPIILNALRSTETNFFIKQLGMLQKDWKAYNKSDRTNAT